MIKRLFALLLCAAMLLCNVPKNYVYADDATVTELSDEDKTILQSRRETVYAEMYKMATVMWRATSSFTYVYSGTEVNIVKGRLYRGIPYTHARSNYESFMELLDAPNDKGEHNATLLNAEMLTGGSLNARFGNDCSGATSAAYAKISTTVKAAGSSTTTPSQGYLHVSPEKYLVSPSDTKNRNSVTANNGEQVMYSIYADAQLADIFACDGHNIMAQYVQVAYGEDGTIDGENSYLIFTHQTPAPITEERVYTTGEFAEANYGEKVYMTYQLDHKWSFKRLYDSGYIVLTCKELVDPSPITTEVSVTDTLPESEHNFANILSGKLTAVNGLIESVIITITDEKGKQVQQGKARTPRNTNSVTNHAMTFDLDGLRSESPMKVLGTMNPQLLGVGSYHCQIDCKLYSGETIEKVRDYDFEVTSSDLPKNWVDNSNISEKFAADTTMAVCPVCGGDPVEWTALTKISSAINLTVGGHYYLSKDLLSNGSHYAISNGTACVHLNGHNITSSARTFYASTKGTFNIMGNGIVKGGSASKSRATLDFGSAYGKFNLYGGTYGHNADSPEATVHFESAGTVNMYSGATICKMSGDMGKNVFLNKGTFNMYGGLIADGYDYNKSTAQYGGNLKVGDGSSTKATFNMYGGIISGGMAQYAGNVFVYGSGAKFNMTGGELYLGQSGVRDGQGSGGNIYISRGATAKLDGLIHYGKSCGQDNYGGGNILVRGGSIVTIGGTVTKGNGDYDSDANRNGSNLAVYEDAQVTITGTISNPLKATKMGGNIFARDATVTVDGGTVTGGSATYRGGNIALQNKTTMLILKNSAKVLDGQVPTTEKYQNWGGNIYATNGAVIRIEGSKTEVSGGISHSDGGKEICLFDGAALSITGGTISGQVRVSNKTDSYKNPSLYMYGGTIKDILDKGENTIQLYNGTLKEQPSADWIGPCACYTKVSSSQYTIVHTGTEGVTCACCGLAVHTGDHVLGTDQVCDTCQVVGATLDGTSYTNVVDALAAAAVNEEQQTVTLMADAVVESVLLTDTVDLNGNTLYTNTILASNKIANIIDAKGDGLLICQEDNLSMYPDNDYLPVKTSDGFRFETISMRQKLEDLGDHKMKLKFLIDDTVDQTYLDDVIKTGNEVVVQIKVSWMENGQRQMRAFAYPEELVLGYAGENWGKRMFVCTITGLDKLVEPIVTAELVSCGVVVAASPA